MQVVLRFTPNWGERSSWHTGVLSFLQNSPPPPEPQATQWSGNKNLPKNEILPLSSSIKRLIHRYRIRKGFKQQCTLVCPQKNPNESPVFQFQSRQTVNLTQDATVFQGNGDISHPSTILWYLSIFFSITALTHVAFAETFSGRTSQWHTENFSKQVVLSRRCALSEKNAICWWIF